MRFTLTYLVWWMSFKFLIIEPTTQYLIWVEKVVEVGEEQRNETEEIS